MGCGAGESRPAPRSRTMMYRATADGPSLESASLDKTPISFETMLRIIRAEFREMPGMYLTRAQFRRLWALTAAESDRLLEHLLGTGYLRETAHGAIGRPGDA